MAEFEELRGALAARRAELDRQREAALLAREELRRTERAAAESGRTTRPPAEGEAALPGQALREARARAEGAAAALAGLATAEDDLRERFAAMSDPREALAHWSGVYPILLLPLRVETRFRPRDGGRPPQLWVRVYPDTCLVDSFEPSLTAQEVDNARAFWGAVWRAGGDDAGERTAWRDLVAAHGSGRSGWIVRQYLPLNPLDKPERTDPAEVLLIIVAADPLPDAARAYWEATWRAGGNPATGQAAYDALVAAVGAGQARDIADRYQPVNFADAPTAPYTRADAPVSVTVLRLTPPENMPTRRTSWSSAPRVDLLPERFAVLGYHGTADPLVAVGQPIRTPLIAGPDPSAPPDQQLKPVGDTLQIPDQLAWMFDFDQAVAAGMALRLDLDAQQATAGFDRLLVLGLRFADSPADGRRNLERLLEHHLYSRTGLEILPQGTPTNNTEKAGAGYSFRDDPDASFDVFFRQTPQYELTENPLSRCDGQWLADMVGLRHDLVQRFPHAGGRDQSEARAMQIALWPGTLGYAMRSLLAPVFSEEQIVAVRDFFTRYVSGRGPLPALRIGRQPYGILPTAAFGRLSAADPGSAFLNRIDDDWAPLVERLSYMGRPGADPHQVLLDVLGLHPGSVEYHPLQSDSVAHKFFELAFLSFPLALELLGLYPAVIPLTLLRRFGYTGDRIPQLLNQVYRARQTPLTGPLIDDRPLSESDLIRHYAGDRNYIQWLVDAAHAGIEQVQQEQGFDGDVKPTALLYLMARHALQVALHTAGIRLLVAAEAIEDPGPLWPEPPFVHVSGSATGSESRYDPLFRPAPRVTGSESTLLGDYIAANARQVDPELGDQIEALNLLGQLPTARLERLFAEHIDTVSYRLDAWRTGILARHLATRPGQAPGIEGRHDEGSRGLFLGAFGWLEAVHPAATAPTPADLPGDLDAAVSRPGDARLMRGSGHDGLIHAPSLNHATTAAVLRNGYLANDGRLAVNLSSRRVRMALAIQEGIRAGQPLGALLGYRFERYVHDNGPLRVQDLIYELRRAFPLAADQIASTKTDGGEARESIAAMNVMDGRKLVEHVEANGRFTYPFGLTTLPRRDADQEAALTSALAHIRDANDALADLVLAEAVHQAVLGNYEQSAGTLDAFAKGGYPPDPDVVRTPRSGIGLTLRTAIHLMPAPPANPVPAIALTPLAAAEPRLNAWLTGWLPDPDDVGCPVTFVDRATGDEHTELITQSQLGLQPIDLLYRVDTAAEQALGDLDDRILTYLHARFAPRHDREIRIRYTERVAGRYTWFQLQPLLRSLRELAVAARPLEPADLARHNDATTSAQATATVPKQRVTSARDDLHDNQLPGLDALATALADATVPIDTALSRFAATLSQLAAYRLPQTGTGFVFEWRAGAYTALAGKLTERVRTWDSRLADYDQRIDRYDRELPAATTEKDRIAFLRAVELLVSTRLTTPEPATAAEYRQALDLRRAAFVTRRDDLRELVGTARPTLAQLLADTEGQLPLTDVDPDPLDLTADTAEIGRFRQRLADAVTRLTTDVARRIAEVDALLAQHDSAPPAGRVRLLQQAVKRFLGEDFQLIPEITLPSPMAAELDLAWQHSTSGDLTRHLTDPAGTDRDFPVDDWLHGVARVREKLRHWENVILLSEAFGAVQAGELTPLQLPYRPGEPWLALEIPEDYRIDSDRLLYTAHFAERFDSSRPVAGLLVDEWTEVVPASTQTTGIAFHLGRPNAEPPQAWLLAVSPGANGRWSWDELLDAVTGTLDRAKRRAIEPVHLDATAYRWFLPATTSAYTFPEISISNNLLRNLAIYSRLPKD